MIILKVIHTFFFALYTIMAFFVGALLAIITSGFAADKPGRFHRVSQIWARYFILPMAGAKVEVEGLENIPEKPVIFVSNHQSYADIPILLAWLPRTFHFIAKKELFRIPFLGWYMRTAGHVLIDREVGTSAHRALEKAVSAVKRGASIVIFPEGTRSRDGELQEFKRGSLMLAFRAEAPVVPLAIQGSFKILPRGSFLISPARVKIKIGRAISIQEYQQLGRGGYEEAIKKVRGAIANLSGRPGGPRSERLRLLSLWLLYF